VKFLFDENLSPQLPELLSGVYPGSLHVKHCQLSKASDSEIWEYAKSHGLTIVSKDFDFQERSVLRGSPPKVIWLRIPNCKNAAVVELLRNSKRLVERFIEHDTATFLALGK
jgi:predicted nuclease of predicted toxin-antitoxin system